MRGQCEEQKTEMRLLVSPARGSGLDALGGVVYIYTHGV